MLIQSRIFTFITIFQLPLSNSRSLQLTVYSLFHSHPSLEESCGSPSPPSPGLSVGSRRDVSAHDLHQLEREDAHRLHAEASGALEGFNQPPYSFPLHDPYHILFIREESLVQPTQGKGATALPSDRRRIQKCEDSAWKPAAWPPTIGVLPSQAMLFSSNWGNAPSNWIHQISQPFSRVHTHLTVVEQGSPR